MNNAIKSLKNKNSSGFDDISNKLIKKAAPHLLTALVFCTNKAIEEGKFPSIFKTSKILPLYKEKDNPAFPTNYRPISQLSGFSKLIEKIILSQTNQFLIENNIIHENQFGFRNNHGTNHALLLTLNDLETARNKNLFSIIVNLDLSKAFDTVNVSEILPAKLKHYFSNEKTVNLISSFFKNRQQYVQFADNIKSTTANNFDISVVQGSALGPNCFSLYINDLPHSTSMTSVLFADDTNLILSGSKLNELAAKVNEELCNIKQFLTANKLSLNTSKTTFSVIPPKNKKVTEIIKIKIGNDEIKETNEFKFLGVLVNKNFRFKGQFENVLNKVKKGVNALIRAKHILNYQAKIKIYHSLIHSHLNYCCMSWISKISSKQLKQLATLQKRALRAIFNAKFNAHTNILFNLSRVTKVEDLFEKESLLFMYKYKENLLPLAITKAINNITEVDSPLTRNQTSSKSLSIKGLKKGDIFYDMIEHWNNCDSEIKNRNYEIPSIKQRINHLLRQRYDYSCDRTRCYSCFRTNEVGLECYMKQ